MSNSNDRGSEKKEKVFAVFRNGFRVSPSEYNSIGDAQYEYEYWRGILTNWPDGSKLNVQEINRYVRPTQEKV